MIAVFLFLILLSIGCSKDGGGLSSKSASSRPIQAGVVETINLQNAIKANPEYKIHDSELVMLQNEGILTEAENAQLQALQ